MPFIASSEAKNASRDVISGIFMTKFDFSFYYILA